MARITNEARGVRAVLMKDRSYLYVGPGCHVEVDRGRIAIIGGGLAIDGQAVPGGGVKIGELDVRFRPEKPPRFVMLPPVPPSLAEKAKRRPREDDTFTGFLDRSVKAIADDLPAQSIDKLERMLADERRGKSRKSLIPLIEAEIASRG